MGQCDTQDTYGAEPSQDPRTRKINTGGCFLVPWHISPIQTHLGLSHRPTGEEKFVQIVHRRACQRHDQPVVHCPLVLVLRTFCFVVSFKDVLCSIMLLTKLPRLHISRNSLWSNLKFRTLSFLCFVKGRGGKFIDFIKETMIVMQI